MAATYAPVVPGKADLLSARCGRASGLPHRVVVRDRTCSTRSAGPWDSRSPSSAWPIPMRARIPAASARAQLLFAHAALSDPAQGAPARPAIGAGARRPRRSRERRHRRAHRRLDTRARRQRHIARTWRAKDSRSISRSRRRSPPARGRSRLQPQGAARESQASYYYSEPQLRVSGPRRLRQGRCRRERRRVARSRVVERDARRDALGWDWIGVNLDDGGALMAFRIRGRDGARALVERHASHARRSLAAIHAARRALSRRAARWSSPRTGTDYPVAMDVEIDGNASGDSIR